MDIAFLPNVQESIMDELRTTEGMIFRDEGAKKLFLDMKYFVFETLYTMYKSMDEQHYQTYLDNLIEWDDKKLIKDLVNRASTIKDISERLTVVTVLYAKYLYATSHPEKSVSIKKPKLEYLIRGMITRLSKMHHIRSGSFYQLDPLKQDFVFRDTFRQSLGNDCIEVSSPITSPVTSPVTSQVTSPHKNEEKTLSEKADEKTLFEEIEQSLNQETVEYKTELVENNLITDNKTVLKEIYDNKTVLKEDNKTVVQQLSDTKTVLNELTDKKTDNKTVVKEDNKTVLKENNKDNKTLLKEDNKTVLRDDKTVLKELLSDKKASDSKTVVESKTVVREKNLTLQSLEEISRKDPNEVYPDDSISQVMGRMGAGSVAHSHVSRSSQFKMPTIRRVKLEDENN